MIKPKSSSAKSGQKKRVASKHRAVSTPRENLGASVSTYDAWLSKQVKERVKHPSPVAKTQGSIVLESTFDTWLRKQHVVGKQAPVLARPSTDTYDEWITKQIAERQSRPEEDKEIKPMTETIPEG